jgi:hypothetical protein
MYLAVGSIRTKLMVTFMTARHSRIGRESWQKGLWYLDYERIAAEASRGYWGGGAVGMRPTWHVRTRMQGFHF